MAPAATCAILLAHQRDLDEAAVVVVPRETARARVARAPKAQRAQNLMGHCPKDGLLVDINGIIQDLNHRMTAGRDLAGLVAGGLGATMERVGAMKGTANYSGHFL